MNSNPAFTYLQCRINNINEDSIVEYKKYPNGILSEKKLVKELIKEMDEYFEACFQSHIKVYGNHVSKYGLDLYRDRCYDAVFEHVVTY
jgi:hypothetical protein